VKIADQIRPLLDATDEEIVDRLAIGLAEEVEATNPHSAEFLLFTNRFWQAAEYDLYKRLCDSTRQPQPWIAEILNGDFSDLAAGIVGAIASQLSVGLGIAIPLTAILLKRTVAHYCAIGGPPVTRRTARQVLASRRRRRR